MYKPTTRTLIRRGAAIALLAALAGPQASRAASLDPTLPPQVVPGAADAAADKAPSIELQAIVCGNGPCRAIISGKRYTAGDVLAGQKILSIDHNRVVLEHGSETKTLFLLEPLLRQDRAK